MAGNENAVPPATLLDPPLTSTTNEENVYGPPSAGLRPGTQFMYAVPQQGGRLMSQPMLAVPINSAHQPPDSPFFKVPGFYPDGRSRANTSLNAEQAVSKRWVDLSRHKLKAVSRTSALLAGFAMVALVENDYDPATPVKYIEYSWFLSTCVGLFLFLVEITVILWVKFVTLEIYGPAIMTTAILVPVMVLFVVFAYKFYRGLDKHINDDQKKAVWALREHERHLEMAAGQWSSNAALPEQVQIPLTIAGTNFGAQNVPPSQHSPIHDP